MSDTNHAGCFHETASEAYYCTELASLRARVKELEIEVERQSNHRETITQFAMADKARATAAEKERDALTKFKAYVHQRLDEAGIPTHPDGEHSKHGCRIGDRLDLLIRIADEADKVEQRALAAESALSAARGAWANVIGKRNGDGWLVLIPGDEQALDAALTPATGEGKGIADERINTAEWKAKAENYRTSLESVRKWVVSDMSHELGCTNPEEAFCECFRGFLLGALNQALKVKP